MILASLVASSTAGNATTYFEQKTVCPVGGKSFKHQAIGSYSTWGALPDGMPVGSGPFPMPQTECPDNGLVLWRDFSKADVQKLTPLVMSPVYQALRKTETQSYRNWWLADQLGEKDNAPWILLTATWEAKEDAADTARLARYQQRFVDAALARPADPHKLASVALRARAANALREMGRFADAERERAVIVIADDAKSENETGDAAENRKGWRGYLEALGVVIARHDASRSPIDMIGDREAVFRCAMPNVPKMRDRAPALNAFEQSYCARPELAEQISQAVKDMSSF